MKKTSIDFIGKRKFKATIRGHEVYTDLPEAKGGEDAAPNPSELFVASFGSCVALFVLRYLEVAKLDPEGLSVDIEWDFSEDKSRIGSINMLVHTPNAVSGARKKAVLAAAKSCVIHNTLHQHPEIKIRVEGE